MQQPYNYGTLKVLFINYKTDFFLISFIHFFLYTGKSMTDDFPFNTLTQHCSEEEPIRLCQPRPIPQPPKHYQHNNKKWFV